jgi:hypothetical protein
MKFVSAIAIALSFLSCKATGDKATASLANGMGAINSDEVQKVFVSVFTNIPENEWKDDSWTLVVAEYPGQADVDPSTYRVFIGSRKKNWSEPSVEDVIVGFSDVVLQLENDASIDLPSPTNMGGRPSYTGVIENKRQTTTLQMLNKKIGFDRVQPEVEGWGVPLSKPRRRL